jgi:hypothetical protein
MTARAISSVRERDADNAELTMSDGHAPSIRSTRLARQACVGLHLVVLWIQSTLTCDDAFAFAHVQGPELAGRGVRRPGPGGCIPASRGQIAESVDGRRRTVGHAGSAGHETTPELLT